MLNVSVPAAYLVGSWNANQNQRVWDDISSRGAASRAEARRRLYVPLPITYHLDPSCCTQQSARGRAQQVVLPQSSRHRYMP